MPLAPAAHTIFALASAPGRAGVAVFRISGPNALDVLRHFGVSKPIPPRVATLVQLTHEGKTIDHALALYFNAPHSFTGEEVVELHTHGGRAITRMLLDALATIPGLKIAEPGEFSRRSFFNEKFDLTQIEAIGDLIDAETPAQHAQAIRQMGGDTMLRINNLRDAILEPLALLEAYIDFPEEEIPPAVLAQVDGGIKSIIHQLNQLLDDGRLGERIREGLEVVILGPPNAGKSSLINTLARRELAIVSARAGTTRDLIEIQLEISGFSVTLIDTAGLREGAGEIEAEGIRRALQRADRADIRLYLNDIVSIPDFLENTSNLLNEIDLLVATKSDLGALPSLPPLPFPVIEISTINGNGVDILIATLEKMIEEKMAFSTPPLITRARHRNAMNQALSCLMAYHTDAALELNCEELRMAAQAIGKITGKIWVDELLGVIFSRFCIGK